MNTPMEPNSPNASHSRVRPNNTSPLASIIVAAYNVEAYIGQCVESLVNQSLQDIEIIAIDDASTDGTFAILAHFAREHANVRLIRHSRNRGLSAVRNTGMESARGKYFAFLDGDDLAACDMLAALTNMAESASADIVVADFQTFDNQTICFDPGSACADAGRLDAESRAEALDPAKEPQLFDMHCSAGKKLYLRSFVERAELKFQEGHIYEDIYFHFAVMLSARRVALLDRTVFYYRINRPGQITEMADERVLHLFTSFDANEDLLAKRGASEDAWWYLLSKEVAVANWVRERTSPAVRRVFIDAAAAHFAKLSPEAWTIFRHRASVTEMARFLGLRKGRDTGPAFGHPPFDLRARAAIAKYGLRILPKLARKVTERMKRATKNVGGRIAANFTMLP